MATTIASYDTLETLGRVRLSRNFFMRDFLYSEIAAWHGIRNVPDDPDQAVAAGRMLCERLLEPLQDTFGRVHIRSGYRSPTVNRFGNENKLNCASNEANYAHHIWDYPDGEGKHGATACIVIPWLVDHAERGGSWTDMAWWIHDHLPYSSLCFFPKLAAFNINWHEAPIRRIDSYSAPKGCLTRPGMPNHAGSHADQYASFPQLYAQRDTRQGRESAPHAPPHSSRLQSSPPKPTNALDQPVKAGTPGRAKPPFIAKNGVASRAKPTGVDPKGAAAGQRVIPAPVLSQARGAIQYRAIHTRNLWRKVGNHRSLEAAINGRDGAAGLFARKVRISYETHGDPLYVLAWEAGASHGYVVKADPSAANGIRRADVPMADLLRFEAHGQASQRELENYFRA